MDLSQLIAFGVANGVIITILLLRVRLLKMQAAQLVVYADCQIALTERMLKRIKTLEKTQDDLSNTLGNLERMVESGSDDTA